MNLLSNMDEVANIIIRPSRYFYKITDLGPKVVTVQQFTVTRHDFEVKNSRGQTLKASLFTTCSQMENVRDIMIYLHCNSGCRLQGLAYMTMVIKFGFSYVIFDFSGSGNSDGKYVSLGFYEVDDLTTIIDHLKIMLNKKIKIALWGRSMGAVTALRYLGLKRNGRVKVTILDSPFQSLKQLFLEIGKQKTSLPSIVLEVAYKYLKPIIQEKAQFNIDEVNLQFTKEKKCPAIFIASKNDFLIPFKQIQQIFSDYEGQKEMFFIDQSHNESRNNEVIKKVLRTARKHFDTEIIQQIQDIKLSYYSFVQKKNNNNNHDTSRQKLQLTIKSYSQRVLTTKQPKTPQKSDINVQSLPCLQKRQVSALFPRKNSVKFQEQQRENERGSLQTRRKLIAVKKFFSDQTSQNEIGKLKPKINWQQSKLGNKQKQKHFAIKIQKDKQRKTLQNMTKKRPPFSELKHPNQFRNSFQTKTKLQVSK